MLTLMSSDSEMEHPVRANVKSLFQRARLRLLVQSAAANELQVQAANVM